MANKKFSQFTNQAPTVTTFVVGYDGTTNVRMPVSSVEGGWNAVTETTTSRSATDKEFIVINNSTCVITLPPPVAQYRISFKVTVVPVSIEIKTNTTGVNIDGTDYSSTGFPMGTQWEQRAVICDGTHWFWY
tara:strand:+ start:198 stop:593 length:396 start_codon:yes stop_codon:yes gene_type:complete